MHPRRWKPEVTEAVTRASAIAKEHGHAEVLPLHLFYSLLVVEDGAVANVLALMSREVGALRDQLTDALEALEGSGRPVYDPKPGKALQNLLDLAETERKVLEAEELTEVHLLIALTSVDGGLDRELRKELGLKRAAIVDAMRDVGRAEGIVAAATGSGQAAAASAGSLLQFCTDLTAEARAGELDPVIGRDAEIGQLVEALARRRKNNGVLVGEPGVGKTAVVEGLALAIAQGAVPPVLSDCRILSLDLASMVAGAKYKGEFEERLKKLVRELEATAGAAILFVDEMHLLLGAGGGGGGMDAANLLKPALARGTLRVIGCTTSGEYKKYIEKDPAFARRFVRIDVVEPDDDVCLRILQGVQGRYEEHHGVSFEEEALRAAVTLSKRYIPDRFLPDKAVDLLDDCASNTRVYRERFTQLQNGSADIESVGEDDAPGLERWSGLLSELSRSLRARGIDSVPELGGRAKADLLRVRDAVLAAASTVPEKVDGTQVAARVSLRTGIPVNKMMGKERERLANIEQYLHERLIGQHGAVTSVANAVRKGRAGLKRPNLPIGSFLFLGPTGTGKTELAKTLAEFLFADEKAMIRFDMSEFQQEHTAQRLVGAPPGYVGYEEGGQLTEAVRRKPYSVLLFDEIEKANKRVFDLFLQVLDDGRLTDGQGRTVDFSNSVVIMTSNMGGLWISEQDRKGAAVDPTVLRDMLIDEGRGLRPEFVNRFDEFVIFHSLSPDEVKQILTLQLRGLRKMLDAQRITLEITDPALTKMAEWSYDPAMGGRPVRRTIDQRIINPLSQILVRTSDSAGKTVHVDLRGEDLSIELS